MTAATLDMAMRILVVAVLAYASLVAATAWAVRRRSINPFGIWARSVRRIGDPVIKPLERRVIRLGGNPQDAPVWLIGLAILGGLLLISLVHWLIDLSYTVGALRHAGPRAWLRLAVSSAFGIIMLAIFVRVIASWLGLGPYARWMRPVMVLTDWIVEPIRRLLPPMGMFDFSPMVAWLVLWLARGLIVGLI
jgi:YggT family protein